MQALIEYPGERVMGGLVKVGDTIVSVYPDSVTMDLVTHVSRDNLAAVVMCRARRTIAWGSGYGAGTVHAASDDVKSSPIFFGRESVQTVYRPRGPIVGVPCTYKDHHYVNVPEWTITPTYVKPSEKPRGDGSCLTADYTDRDELNVAGWYVEWDNGRTFIAREDFVANR